jgi:hypothetical protein
MALISRTRAGRLMMGLTAGLAVMISAGAGSDLARAQPAGAAWNAGAQVQMPPPAPQQLPPQAGSLTPLCCAPAAPVATPQAPPAAAAAPAQAAAPARRN